MSILAPNPSMVHRGLCSREQQSYLSNMSACINMPSSVGGFPSIFRNGNRKDIKMRAFWDVSRPMSVEMEPINGVEELEEILAHSKEQSQPIIVDWMAAWCRKCIYLKPKLEKLAAEYHSRLKFYYVDVNKVPQDLVKRGNISKMPTIQLWKNGEWTAEVIGGHKAWLVMDEVFKATKGTCPVGHHSHFLVEDPSSNPVEGIERGEKDICRGLSLEAFRDEVSKKLSLPLQSFRLSYKMKEYGNSNVKLITNDDLARMVSLHQLCKKYIIEMEACTESCVSTSQEVTKSSDRSMIVSCSQDVAPVTEEEMVMDSIRIPKL